MREVAREAGIAPIVFIVILKIPMNWLLQLIERAGVVLRQILHEARIKAIRQESIIRSSVEVFIEQLDADDGNLSL